MLKRPPRDLVLTMAMALFAVGLVAVASAFVLFAVGHRGLPAWLSAASMLLPIGLAIGAIRTVRQWRRSESRPSESADASASEDQGADR